MGLGHRGLLHSPRAPSVSPDFTSSLAGPSPKSLSSLNRPCLTAKGETPLIAESGSRVAEWYGLREVQRVNKAGSAAWN